MTLEHTDSAAARPVENDASAVLRDSAWVKGESESIQPSAYRGETRQDSSAQLTAPTFVNPDGSQATASDMAALATSGTRMKPRDPVQLALMSIDGADGQPDVLQVADLATRSNPRRAAERVQQAAHAAVGSSYYGDIVPRDAAKFAGLEIPKNVKCASTSSELLIEGGFMTNRDYQIRVTDLMDLLPRKGFTRVNLNGDFDISKFPDGPIGFIAGIGNNTDGSNHIGFIEKRNGEVRVIHNNYRTGQVVDQNITEKFYNQDGTPAYKNLSLFMFPRTQSSRG